jgi:hypothetical protein
MNIAENVLGFCRTKKKKKKKKNGCHRDYLGLADFCKIWMTSRVYWDWKPNGTLNAQKYYQIDTLLWNESHGLHISKNPRPGLGQAQQYCGGKPVNEITITSSWKLDLQRQCICKQTTYLSNSNLKLLESSRVWHLMQVCLFHMQKLIWEKLNTRRKIRKLSLFYNIVKGDTPDYLSDLLPLTVNQTNNYNLRNANNVTIPRCRLTLYQNSFFSSHYSFWNNLSQYIRDSPSNCILKSRLKTYYNNSVILVPPKYFSFGSRLVSILHTRLRQNCSSLKGDRLLLL